MYVCIGRLPCMVVSCDLPGGMGCFSLACLGVTCLLWPSQIQNSNQAVATTEFWSWSKRKSMLVCLSGAVVPCTRQSSECLPPCNFYKKKTYLERRFHTTVLETKPEKKVAFTLSKFTFELNYFLGEPDWINYSTVLCRIKARPFIHLLNP